ncbi:hypothetical protein K431DRAFT_285771 [Polychaeton citri CBS 116435]|uniref:DNA recombination and repair protein Rad51-like C-terminal domain-containing protein n=1 Tax=Polychaeton citri CBS 116435 TaxID=1314669 RepID=A0A9P4Q4K0_9PEZI|nr:hypothetical protein K431DRAFT_285771 [Polychaeton citri CBS 116435]
MPASVISDDEVEEQLIVDIDQLQAHGIGQADIGKMKAAGLYTVASVHSSTTKTLLKIRGFSEVKVEKVKEAVRKCLPNGAGYVTGHELLQLRRRCFRISTGSKQWDSILNGLRHC